MSIAPRRAPAAARSFSVNSDPRRAGIRGYRLGREVRPAGLDERVVAVRRALVNLGADVFDEPGAILGATFDRLREPGDVERAAPGV